MFAGTYEKPKVKRFETTRLWNNLKRNK